MSRRVKAVLIASIARELERTADFIVINTSRSTGVQENRLRHEIRKCGFSSLGVKTCLAKVAATRIGRREFAEALAGASTLIFGCSDLYVLCHDVNRLISDFGATIVCGMTAGTVLDASDVLDIAKGLNRHEWICQIASSLLSPGAQVVGAFNSPSEALTSQLDCIVT